MSTLKTTNFYKINRDKKNLELSEGVVVPSEILNVTRDICNICGIRFLPIINLEKSKENLKDKDLQRLYIMGLELNALFEVFLQRALPVLRGIEYKKFIETLVYKEEYTLYKSIDFYVNKFTSEDFNNLKKSLESVIKMISSGYFYYSVDTVDVDLGILKVD